MPISYTNFISRLLSRNALDLLPTTIFPNFPPGGQVDDENNQKAIEALKNAKEYTIVDEEDALHQESILSKYLNLGKSVNGTDVISHCKIFRTYN